jgi:hypothetical protein
MVRVCHESTQSTAVTRTVERPREAQVLTLLTIPFPSPFSSTVTEKNVKKQYLKLGKEEKKKLLCIFSMSPKNCV